MAEKTDHYHAPQLWKKIIKSPYTKEPEKAQIADAKRELSSVRAIRQG